MRAGEPVGRSGYFSCGRSSFDVFRAVLEGIYAQLDALHAFQLSGDRLEVERDVITLRVAGRIAARAVAEHYVEVSLFARAVAAHLDVAAFGCVGRAVHGQGERVLRVVGHGIECIEGQPLAGEVEGLRVEACPVAAQRLELLLGRDHLRRAGEDFLRAVEADVVVVSLDGALEQVEVDHRATVVLGLEARGPLARVERLAVVALEIVVCRLVSFADRMDRGDQTVDVGVVSVVVVAARECREAECGKQRAEHVDFFHGCPVLSILLLLSQDKMPTLGKYCAGD